DARGGTAYVSLEPCAHHGKTAPCSDALIDAGVARVVSSVRDPDPRVAGRGIEALRQAGIDVVEGLLEQEAAELNAGFFLRVNEGRPLVTLKVATSLDGKIATASGESQWITGEPSRARVHMMRAENDAILIGAGTALADDPALTCRLPGMAARSPVRILVDAGRRVPDSVQLFQTARTTPTILATRADAPGLKPLEALGVEILPLPADGPNHVDLAALLRALGERGLTRVMVEGGGGMGAALLRLGLVDRLAWFRAPLLIGGEGIPAIADLAIDRLADAPGFERTGVETIGTDLLETYRRRA
ncbi:MAG: bifunctional diaminohydroxyphosphoribosylaminopyrimidine deaminase/5-amino-6-(5-phosphoribosylamino)uracil reductase RibD, partial [Rhodospirillaceae bacterium]|nr:bifunctional diaminohydroxyphosphoribosylaminopyrimidine deaminase/5-amino-6-(5-phosphoribosylamino)uracil reductase RibD [Rhodospirillaceae bacterium]